MTALSNLLDWAVALILADPPMAAGVTVVAVTLIFVVITCLRHPA